MRLRLQAATKCAFAAQRSSVCGCFGGCCGWSLLPLLASGHSGRQRCFCPLQVNKKKKIKTVERCLCFVSI